MRKLTFLVAFCVFSTAMTLAAQNQQPIPSRLLPQQAASPPLPQQPLPQRNHNSEISGTVFRPDGTPAAGTEIAVGSKGNSIYINNGHFDRERTQVLVQADASGKFSFPDVGGQYSLVVLDESGSAIVRQENFEIARTIHLTPFFEVTGNVIATPGQKRTARLDCYLDAFSFGKGGWEKLEGYVIAMFLQTDIQADGSYKFLRCIRGTDINNYPFYHYSEPVAVYQDEKQELVYPTRLGSSSNPQPPPVNDRGIVPAQGKAVIPDEWKEAVKTSIAYLYFEPVNRAGNTGSRFFSPNMPTVPDVTLPPITIPRLIDLRHEPYEYTRIVTEEVQRERANIQAPRFREYTFVVPLNPDGSFPWDAKMPGHDVYLFLRPKNPVQGTVEDKWVAKCYLGNTWTFPDHSSDVKKIIHNPPSGVIYLQSEKTLQKPFIPKKITLHIVDENGRPVNQTELGVFTDIGHWNPGNMTGNNGRYELVFPENMRGGNATYCFIQVFQRPQVSQDVVMEWERKGGRWETIPEQLTFKLSKRTPMDFPEENTGTPAAQYIPSHSFQSNVVPGNK